MKYTYRYTKIIEATPENPARVEIPVPDTSQSKGIVAVIKPL